jgi:hypothetical protein
MAKSIVAADQRRGRRAKRLEPALHHARAHYLICLHRIGEALRFDAAEIAVLKQTAQQTAGGCIDGDGARRRPGLQTRRHVRCLTDHKAELPASRAICAHGERAPAVCAYK